MQTLRVRIFFENLPKYEQKLGVKIFFNNFIKTLQENNVSSEISSYGSGINIWDAQISISEVRYEKVISVPLKDSDCIYNRYPSAKFETCDEKFIAIVPEESLEKRILDTFNKILSNHQWSTSMHFGSYCCVRPIRKISLKLDRKFLLGNYASIIFSSFEELEKSFDTKKEKIYKLLEKYFIETNLIEEEIIEDNCATISEPTDAVLEFDQKYLEMPFDLINQILEKILCFSIAASNKCIIIIDKNIKINKESLQKVINNHMNDVYILFQEDIYKTNLFEKSQKIFLGNNLGKVAEKTARMQLISQNMNLQDISPLIDIYYYDLSSHIVQNYPSLKGIIAQKIIPNYGKIIRNAHKAEQDFTSQALKSLEYIDNILILPQFSSSKDPFGLKKQIDFVTDFFLKNDLYFDFQEKNNLFIKRIKARLKDHRKFLHAHSLKDQINILKLAPFHLSTQKIIRILNIIKSANKLQSIELKEKFDNLQASNLSQKIDSLIEYIENHHITPYIERIEMIEKFIQELYKVIDIQSLLRESL